MSEVADCLSLPCLTPSHVHTFPLPTPIFSIRNKIKREPPAKHITPANIQVSSNVRVRVIYPEVGVPIRKPRLLTRKQPATRGPMTSLLGESWTATVGPRATMAPEKNPYRVEAATMAEKEVAGIRQKQSRPQTKQQGPRTLKIPIWEARSEGNIRPNVEPPVIMGSI